MSLAAVYLLFSQHVNQRKALPLDPKRFISELKEKFECLEVIYQTGLRSGG